MNTKDESNYVNGTAYPVRLYTKENTSFADYYSLVINYAADLAKMPFQSVADFANDYRSLIEYNYNCGDPSNYTARQLSYNIQEAKR